MTTATYDFRSAVKDALLPSGVTTAAANGSILSSTSAGLSVAGSSANPPSFAFADAALNGASNGSDEWLIIRASTSAGQSMQLGFTDRSTDPQTHPSQEFSWRTRPDGVMHTYNCWIGACYIVPRTQVDTETTPDPCTIEKDATHPGGFPGNQAKVILHQSFRKNGLGAQVTVFPSEVPGASGAVEYIKLASQPDGPALLVVDYFGPILGEHRQPWANCWGLRLWNLGGQTATGISLAFSSATGLTVVAQRFIDDIPPGEDRTFEFDVTAATASTTTSPDTWKYMTVTATCAQGDAVTATGRVWIDPSAAGAVAGQIPTTTPIPRSNKRARIGCWYFPAWGWFDAFHPPSIAHTCERWCELGNYDQEDPNVHAWFWYFGSLFGLDYWNIEWVAIQAEKLRRTMNAVVANSKIALMKFQLSYINHEGTGLPNTRLYDGIGIWPTSGAPSSGLGNQNDYAFDVTAGLIYGPRGASSWPAQTVQCVTASTATAGDPACTATTITTTATWAAFTTTITVASAANLQVGQGITATGIATNSVITAIAGKSITLSKATTVAATTATTVTTTLIDPRVVYAVAFLHMIQDWLPYLGHASYHRTSDNKLRISVYVCQYLYDQLNNITPSKDAGRFTALRTAFLASVLGRAGQLVLAAVPDAAGVAWCGQVNQNQGGADGDGISTGGTGNSTRYTDMGFVVSESYNWFGAGSVANVMTAAQARAYGETTRWSGQCNGTFNSKTIRPAIDVLCGFNHGRWVQPRNPGWVVNGWTYEVMKAHLQAALAYLDAHVSSDQQDLGREICLEAWDEWGEGSHAGPCGESQFMFLRAMFEVFVISGAIPSVIVPRDVGLTVTQCDEVYRWVQFPTRAIPTVNTHTKQGVTIPRGAYPAVESAASTMCIVRG